MFEGYLAGVSRLLDQMAEQGLLEPRISVERTRWCPGLRFVVGFTFANERHDLHVVFDQQEAQDLVVDVGLAVLDIIRRELHTWGRLKGLTFLESQ